MRKYVKHVAILTNQLVFTDGSSNHLFYLLSGFKQTAPDVRFTVITGRNTAEEKFSGQFNGEIIVIPEFLYEQRTKLRFIKNIAVLVGLIFKYRFDILHSHTHYHANMARVAGILTGRPTIQTNHGLFEDLGKLRQYNADHYICVSRHLEDYMIQNELAKVAQCNFIRHGINPVIPDSGKLSAGKYCFIAAGRFIYNKAFDIYINAVAGLPQHIRGQCAFYIAGTGEEEESLKQLNADLNAGVIFLGDVNKIRETFAKCDVFVNMTRSTEGSPVSLAEAALSGCFIITTRYFGIEAAFVPGEDGATFNPDDTAGLQEAITDYCLHPEKAATIAQRYFKKASALFSVQLMVEKTRNLYNRVLK